MKLRDAPALLAALARLDRSLRKLGFHGLSPWWLATFTRFLRSGKRQLVARVGRRGGKSSSLCALAVLFAVFAEHAIPRGDRGVVAFVSVSRDEATNRLHTIEALLGALRVPFRRVGDSIELRDKPIVFKVFAATMQGVVGFTSVLVICDEVARWRDADTGANPAGEVLASLRPTMATVPTARMVLSSSPLGTTDAHAEAFDLGDTDEQMVAHAPTWEANPTLSEADTRRLEPDARIHAREYRAIPQAGSLDCFESEAVDRAFALAAERIPNPVMVLDPSSGKSDAFTFAIAGWTRSIVEGRVALRVERIGAIEGRFWDSVTGTQIVDRIASAAKLAGVRAVHGDQRESLMLRAALQERGLTYYEHPWTGPNKTAAVTRLRRLMADGQLSIEPHDKLRKELLGFQEKVTSGGQFTFAARRSGHDDFVALLITATLADIAGRLQTVSSAELERQWRQVSSVRIPFPAVDAAFDHSNSSGLPKLHLSVTDHQAAKEAEELASGRGSFVGANDYSRLVGGW